MVLQSRSEFAHYRNDHRNWNPSPCCEIHTTLRLRWRSSSLSPKAENMIYIPAPQIYASSGIARESPHAVDLNTDPILYVPKAGTFWWKLPGSYTRATDAHQAELAELYDRFGFRLEFNDLFRGTRMTNKDNANRAISRYMNKNGCKIGNARQRHDSSRRSVASPVHFWGIFLILSGSNFIIMWTGFWGSN